MKTSTGCVRLPDVKVGAVENGHGQRGGVARIESGDESSVRLVVGVDLACAGGNV